MDLAKSLIRSIARSFYAAEHVVIIDALLLHNALRDDDLAYVVGQQTKHLRRLASKLREDGIISVHTRAETREGAQRPFNRDYYYVNFHRAIDVVKYRIKKMITEVERMFGARATEERKEYRCPQCTAEWTLMEVLPNVDPATGNFLCDRCGHALNHLGDADDDTNQPGGSETKARMNGQLSAFQDLMQQIDNVTIPENDFETAISNALPVQRNAVTNPGAKSQPVTAQGRLPPATVRGMKMESEKIQVALVTDAQQKQSLDKAAEDERKRKLANQNALPAWHTTSTVTGEQTTLGIRQEAMRREQEAIGMLPSLKKDDEEEEEKKKNALAAAATTAGAASAESSGLDAYFAALREEQDREAQVAREEELESGDEDDSSSELDFEDVRPSSSGKGKAVAANGQGSTNGAKRSRSQSEADEADSGSSGEASPSKRRRLAVKSVSPATSTSTKANGAGTPLSKSAAVSAASVQRAAAAKPASANGEDDEDSDEDDFETVI